MHTFIVTNMTVPIKDVIKFYCGRGKMENFIKESKSGKTGRYIYFKLCSSCPYQKEFYETLNNIKSLVPQLE